MDPKKIQGIDPKLQEAYNRIMASPASTPSSTPPPVTSPTNTPPTPVSSEPKSTVPLTPPPLPTLTPIGASSKTAPSSPPVGMIAKKGGAGISPVILIVAAVIFFLVYALFFIKLFNVSVPFLP